MTQRSLISEKKPSTNMIKTIRTSYKIGFSSALNTDTISVYNEMTKWEFVGERINKRKLHKAFERGYASATRIKSEVRYNLKTQQP